MSSWSGEGLDRTQRSLRQTERNWQLLRKIVTYQYFSTMRPKQTHQLQNGRYCYSPLTFAYTGNEHFPLDGRSFLFGEKTFWELFLPLISRHVCVYLMCCKWVAVSWHRSTPDGNCGPNSTLQVVAAERSSRSLHMNWIIGSQWVCAFMISWSHPIIYPSCQKKTTGNPGR